MLKKKGVPFRLTSAKTPKNFSDFLEELVKKYIEKMEAINSTIVDGLKLDEQNESKKSKKKKCC